MQSSKEQQGEIRKPSSVINAKKQRKTIEWERLEIPSIRGTKGRFNAKMGSIKERNGMDIIEAEDIKKMCKDAQKNYTKKIFTTQIITMV